MTTIPPVPPQFEITAALNRALFLEAAVATLAANLAVEQEKLDKARLDLCDLMVQNNMRGVSTTLGSADMVPKIVYNAADWRALQEHIQKTGDFDLLQRRLTQTAMRDRDSNNDLPPGVRRVTLHQLKLSLA